MKAEYRLKPQSLKLTRHSVSSLAASQEVQKLMFKLGFKWQSDCEGDVREVKPYPTNGFIFVDENCRMTQGGPATWSVLPTTSVDRFRLLDVVRDHLLTKAEERKASRKRRAARKAAAAWIPFTATATSVNPLPGYEGEITIRLANTEEFEILAKWTDWTRLLRWPDRCITAYKIPADYVAPVSSDVVTFAAMVADLSKGAPDEDGWIVFTGNTCPVAEDTLIETKFGDGSGSVNKAGTWCWDACLAPEKYRIVTEAAWTLVDEVTDVSAFASHPDVMTHTPLDPSTNPKHAIGSSALPMTMPSALFRAMVALGKANGAGKYGGANYIGTPVVMSTYMNAIQRHFDKILMGEDVDTVDKVPHWGAIGANIDIIVSAQAAGTLIDDRLRADGQLEAVAKLVPLVASLTELHKDRAPKHFYMKDKPHG